eukprot:jgi/Tetstr1/421558/TSEL_012502.t1
MGRHQALRSHFRGCRMLPYMDDFLFFASSRAQAYAVRDRLTFLLGRQGRPQFMFLVINKPARFYLRELHDVLRTKDSCSGRVKMTHQLIRHDLEWWMAVPPNHSNNCSIYKPLRNLRFILDSNDISIRARYINNTANTWDDRLNREIDYDESAFDLRHFDHLDNIKRRHTIDRFAIMETALLPR